MRGGSPCRSGSGRRSPTTWSTCWNRTASPCTWRRRTCARRCAGCARSVRARGPRSGAGPTRASPRSAASSSRWPGSEMAELDPPIQTLFADAPDDLPDALRTAYGGGLGLEGSAVYANFVASIDGIVAISDIRASSKVIGGQDEGDRFVMALLRASADALLMGAGTFRQHRGPWTAQAIAPRAADAFAELRRIESRTETPTLAIVTASGDVEPKPGQDTIVLTTAKGAEAVPAGFSEVVVVGDGDAVDVAGAIAALRERGLERILTEGGPNLMGQLLEARVVDELFLTIAPLFAGGGERPGDRSTLAPGIELLPDRPVPGALLSAKRRNSYLFLRVGLGAEATGEGSVRWTSSTRAARTTCGRCCPGT